MITPGPGQRRRRGKDRPTAGGLLVLVVALLVGACGQSGPPPTDAAHRVVIEPCQGRVAQRATAAAIDDDLLVTVGHTLEAAATIEVRGPTGSIVSGEVIHLDLDVDLALIRTATTLDHHLELAEPEEPGPVTIVTYGEEDGPQIEQGEIIELVEITLDGAGRRAAAKLSAEIDPGDSGGPVVDDAGRLVAMVFATARDDQIGWAVSATEIEAAVALVTDQGPTAALPNC